MVSPETETVGGSSWHPVKENKAVIDETTSHSTKPASWQVAGYPTKAGIQQGKHPA